ncbi:2OG-Fe dioxygenase family protein [Streptomyces sp. 1331.2]|uniref:2OG-Fe dioxygenase family protein n=1 Tax=Streptomyces sp. 1331.2 TaxID=1938835 RepID=UPI000BDC67C5|nr:2OG-Fe dioxygenase family protein [Streptomyces sp. 1331.2]SOB85238.1 hypothetical protein SAMN06272789_5513 [Streptomyces sp. 1331.2]
MALDERHYRFFPVPKLDDSVLREFPTLPVDRYCDGKFRHRRFSQYRIAHSATAGWQLELLPHRPFCQATKFNGVTGGQLRDFDPLRIDPGPLVRAGAEEVPLDTATDWQVDVHQWRIVSDDSTRGVSVPEGPHQDGHTFSVIAVIDRVNITGGETQLLPMDSDEPFVRTVLRPGQAVVLDDRKMRHYATDIAAPPGEHGHRDIFLLAYNTWPERRYGEAYEKAVLAGTWC